MDRIFTESAVRKFLSWLDTACTVQGWHTIAVRINELSKIDDPLLMERIGLSAEKDILHAAIMHTDMATARNTATVLDGTNPYRGDDYRKFQVALTLTVNNGADEVDLLLRIVDNILNIASPHEE